MLDKIPYVNRLFRNVGVDPEKRVVMLIKPRVVVIEEEEFATSGR